MSSSVSSIIGNIANYVGTGFDVQSIVSEIIASQSGPLNDLQTEQTTLNSQTSALNNINSLLQTLQTTVQGLSDVNGALTAQTATSSNANILTATGSSTATPGTHTIVVNSLATTSSYYTASQPSSGSTLNDGSFQIQVGSNSPVTVNVSAANGNNTLDSLAGYINGLGAGVTASVVTDANGARLALVSNTSGAPGDLTVSNDSVGLGFTKAVTGANASLTVDGIPLSSTTNTISTAIQGVTLNLQSALPGTNVSLTVAPDTTQATGAINNFVSAYNSVVQAINSQYAVDSSSGQQGILASDSTLATLQSMLANDVNASTTGNNGIVNLASLGVNMNNDGTLSVDSGALNSALSSNYQNVISFFQNASNTGFAQSFNTDLGNNIVNPANGIIALDLNGISQTQQSLTQEISDFQANLAIQQQQLTTEYSQIDTTLQELPILQANISSALSNA
jgi:flagellar hook-associated protein 2